MLTAQEPKVITKYVERGKRGPRLSTKIKEARQVAEGQQEGFVQGNLRTSTRKKNLERQLLLKISAWVDRIDPLEMVAIIGTTMIIKQGINWSDAVQYNIEWLVDWFATEFQTIIGGKASFYPDYFKKLEKTPQAQIQEWLISFALAFVIIRYFPQVVKAGADILSTAKLLIGLAVT
jgi:hypothetical protein